MGQASGAGGRGAKRLVFVLLVACAMGLGAAEPDRPYTMHDYVREDHAFNVATMLEAYRKVGGKDPRWDTEAIKLLEVMCDGWAYGSAHPMYHPIELPKADDVLPLGKAAIDKGCDDPMVLYCYGLLHRDAAREVEGRAFIRRSYDGFAAQSEAWPSIRVLNAATFRFAFPFDDNDQQAAAEDLVEQSFVRLVRPPFMNTAHKRIALQFADQPIQRGVANIPAALRERLLRRLMEDGAADPYIVDTIVGRYYLGQAQAPNDPNAIRGGRRPDPQASLKLAEERLTRAWQRDPKLPEAPAAMITVAAGAGRAADVRQWLKRALAAQLDHRESYDRAFAALTPRRVGGVEPMLEVAKDAARTRRFDTLAPFQLIIALERLGADGGAVPDRWALWGRDDVYPLVCEVFDGYAAKVSEKAGRTFLGSYHAGLAWRLGRLEEARKALDRLGGKVEPDAFAKVDAGADDVVGQVYGLTGPFKDEFRKAGELLEAKQEAAALKAYAALAAKLPESDKARPYARSQVARLERLVHFAEGKWVSLLPAADVSGWKQTQGTWKADDKGAMVGTAGERGLLLVCDAEFGPRFELVAQIDRPKADAAAGVRRPAQAGVALGFTEPADSYGLWVSGRSAQVMVSAAPGEPKPLEAELGESNEVRLAIYYGRLTADVNGVRLHTEAAPDGQARPGRVALGALSPVQRGAVARFTELKVRRLDRDPAQK